MRIRKLLGTRILLGIILAFLSAFSAPASGQDKVIARASTVPSAEPTKPTPKPQPAQRKATPAKKTISSTARRTTRRMTTRVPTYGNPAQDDDPSRDDPVVRAAAVEALRNLMGSVVVVDPATGRILTVVNQKLAFDSGYQPCSAFKPAVALAALEEGIIEKDRTRLQLGKRWYLDLQQALAISNNLYFEKLGRLLGLERLQEYALLFGFGEVAGWGIEPEPEGVFPEKSPPARQGGVGRIASFGQGISMTLLQLASFTSALANGGTLYYLQYASSAESADFEPRVKRELQIGPWLAAIQEGMEAAVLTGTARKAQQPDVRLVGKTGTCSQNGARLGWFAGYNREPGGVAVVVLLRSGQRLGGGSRASEIAGRIFRTLGDQNYFARSARDKTPVALPASIQIPPFP